MKRKRLDRRHWIGLRSVAYDERRLDIPCFNGICGFLKVISVDKPTYWGNGRIRVIDAGMSWLQFCADGSNALVTAMCNESGGFNHWYIDMIDGLESDNNVVLFNDLYLDLQVTADGKQLICDRDELDEALENGDIDEAAHRRAIVSLEHMLAETSDFEAFKQKCSDIYRAMTK